VTKKLLLVLDDDRERLRGFEEIVARLGHEWQLKTWRNAPGMLAEIDAHFTGTRLISLDHDLYKDADGDPDPGNGRVIADFLSRRAPACPVIVHSTNTDAAWGMHNQLSGAGWSVHLVQHLSQPKWIQELWLPVATRVLLST
jgi:hypothetical protein